MMGVLCNYRSITMSAACRAPLLKAYLPASLPPRMEETLVMLAIVAALCSASRRVRITCLVCQFDAASSILAFIIELYASYMLSCSLLIEHFHRRTCPLFSDAFIICTASSKTSPMCTSYSAHSYSPS